MSRRWVTGQGVELAVDEGGTHGAPTLLLVHGYPDTSAVWAGVAARLRDRYHVVAYDVRGAGASGAPAGRRGYALELLVADMAAVVDAVSPGRPVHLVGHDWGSIQGWEAVTSPALQGRFASYTSIGGPGLDHAAHWVRARRTRPAQLLRQGMRSWYIGAFHLPGASLFWRLGGARLVHGALRRLGEIPADASPEPTLATDGARGVNLYRANVLARLRHPGDRHTSVPVQLIVPQGDRYVTPALLDDTVRWAPTLWRRDVPGRHWLPRTAPDRVAGWIADLVEHAEGGPEPPALARHRVLPADHTGEVRPGAADDLGKVVVVTGAGAAAARTALLCGDLGPPASHHEVDVGDADAMEALAKQVEPRLARLDPTERIRR